MQVVWVFLLLKTSLPKHFTNNFEINLLEYIVVETRGPGGEEGQPPPPKKKPISFQIITSFQQPVMTRQLK